MASRRRINAALPKYVYRTKRGFVYRRYAGVMGGKPVFDKDILLAAPDAPLSVVLRAYEQTATDNRRSLSWLLRAYHDSPQYQSLSERVRETDYPGYRIKLTDFKTSSGSRFGDALLHQISKRTIRGYLDNYPAPIAANRHIQYLKAAWNWCEQRHEIPPNPCTGVKLNEQRARTRYVTQVEFAAFSESVPEYIQLFMELAYLCRARWSEVAALRQQDIVSEGLRLCRGKGSAGELTALSPRLLAALDACKAYNAGAPSPISGAYLIHDKKGRPISRNAFQSAWGRAMRKWVEAGNERFTYHDIKACGFSDMKEPFAGHKSDRMYSVYMRKLRTVNPPE